MAGRYEVGAYYFPNYHVDPRNEAAHGAGWTEWELVRRAHPRFPGHRQPRVPLWGFEDEADPAVFARKIDTAADHGIGHFLFDWYHYEDGPFLNCCLDEGYKGASNRHRLQYALMWANHTWVDIHPAKYAGEPDVLQRGEVSPAGWGRIMDRLVADHFAHPGYLRVDGRPYFSIYELATFLRGLGGVEAGREGLEELRRRCRAAGQPEPHLNCVLWGHIVLPGEQVIQDPARVLPALGFDSFTSYVWVHHVAPVGEPTTPYRAMEDGYLAYAERAVSEIPLPYFPNATVGWDPSPRCCQSDTYRTTGYPWTPVLDGNTPAAFAAALRRVRAHMDRHGIQMMSINAWNEWTEGSYLEPDTERGMGYLRAIREVFGDGG